MRHSPLHLLKLVSSIGVRGSLLQPGTQVSCEFVVSVAYRISGVAMTTYESRIAVTVTSTTREAGTITPAARAITPIKPRGTARAAATAPPIGDPAEGYETFLWFRSSTPKRMRSWQNVRHMGGANVSAPRVFPAIGSEDVDA